MQTLIPEGMKPVLPPEPFVPKPDVVAVCWMDQIPLAMEVFARSGGTFGFRFSAWVGWTDAGGFVAGHSWWSSAPRDSFITDSVESAQVAALAFATSHGLKPSSQWKIAAG